MKKLLLIFAFIGSISTIQAQNVYNYGFSGTTANLTTAGWTRTNQSTVTPPTPPSTTLWTISAYAPVVVNSAATPPVTTLPFSTAVVPNGQTCPAPNGQAGGANSFALVNYTSTSSTLATGATISNWLISPIVNVSNGDIVTFYSRRGKVPGSPGGGFADRLQLRMSTDGSFTVDPATGPTDTGSYSTLLTDINPTLAAAGFPSVWTQYSYTITGLTGPTDVKFGFRYFVANGGPNGSNSDIIGIDSFSVDKPEACSPATNLIATMSGALAYTISWTAPTSAPANGYEYYLSTVNTAPTAATVATGATAAGVTSAALTGLSANTSYFVWIRSVCSASSNSSWSANPTTFNTFTAPNCPTMLTPTNNNSNVPLINGDAVNMTWSAATTGAPTTGYNIYLGSSAATIVKLNPTPFAGTAVNITGLSYGTTYFYEIRSVGAAGESTGCVTFSFTTEQSPFLPYCGANQYAGGVEPITLVNFAGINQASPNAVATGIPHENYISVLGQVTTGMSYPITLKGNTDGNYLDSFIVFIDWNQNEILDDAGEVYFSNPSDMSVTNSTGLDASQAVGSILVPATALPGTTRMRVKKINGITDFVNPCLGADYGQSEDYSINVTDLATSTFNNAAFSAQPNPVKDVLNLSYDKNITNVIVYNLLGQVVIERNINDTQSKLDMSGLTSGAYMVKVTADNQVKTIKVIKE